MTANSLHRNLVLDIQGRNTAIKPGETTLFERELILRNRSDRTIHVDLWIEPSDAKAMPLRQWCQFSNPNPTLDVGQERRVQLLFEIPSQAEPGFYSYDVCAQTPEYIEEVERRSQQLEVLTSDQQITLRNEPVFYLTPPTSSEQPYQLTTGSPLTLQITVENRSKRVDRLFLTCPELPPEWADIEYPEAITDTPGPLTQTDSLQLNPDFSGIITLKLHPPRFTPAGNYSTTLRLTSANQNNLVLLDILYFTIEVNDTIAIALEPQVGHVPGEDSEFGITVQNAGNIQRELMLAATDSDRLFKFTLAPNPVNLAPGEIAQLRLTPTPRKWWRRQWKSRQDVPFRVEIADTIAAPVEIDPASIESIDSEASALAQPLLKVPPPLEGKIVWESHPSWLRWLLIGLLLAGLLTVFTLLTYWLVKKLVVEPSLEPKVLEFSAPSESYQASGENPQGNNPIQLDWEISNVNKLSIVGLTFFSRDTKAEFPLVFDQAWSTEQESCKQEIRPVRPLLGLLYRLYGETPETQVLICQGLQLNPSELALAEASDFEFVAGAYDAMLTLYAPDSSESEEPTSQLSTETATSPGFVKLGTVDLPQTDTQKLSNIQITPSDPPEILYFYSKAPIYREQTEPSVAAAPEHVAASEAPNSESPETLEPGDTDTSESDNAEISQLDQPEAPPPSGSSPSPNDSDTAPVDLSAQFPAAPVELTWIIDRPWEIEALELSYVGVASGGDVLSDRLPRYEMNDEYVPIGLEEQCRPDGKRLICEDVPTPALEAGEYTFTLTVVMPEEQNRDEIAMESEPIKVHPPFPSILSFAINGRQAADHPQQVHIISPDRGSVDVMLEWEVENPKRMQVEILPAPGLVAPSLMQMPFSLSPTPGNTNLTLQVTNEVGETISRSVSIATAAPGSTVRPIVPVPLAPPPDGILLPPPPNGFPPEELEPIRVPPSGN